MKTRIGKMLAAGLVAGALLTSGASAATAQADLSTASTETSNGGDTVQEYYFTATPEASTKGEMSTQAVCTFVQRVDYAHISTKSANRAVQSHGNWGNVNCSYTLATVTNMVQKKNTLGIWVNVGAEGKNEALRPASTLTSSARVTSHYDCSSSVDHRFRSWTDVDVHGIADAPNRQYSPEQILACN